jgi:hypothetical protein
LPFEIAFSLLMIKTETIPPHHYLWVCAPIVNKEAASALSHSNDAEMRHLCGAKEDSDAAATKCVLKG